MWQPRSWISNFAGCNTLLMCTVLIAVSTLHESLDAPPSQYGPYVCHCNILIFAHIRPWPLTPDLDNLFSSVPHMINISAKFRRNPSTMYRDIASRVIGVNGRTAGQTAEKQDAFVAFFAGGDIKIGTDAPSWELEIENPKKIRELNIGIIYWRKKKSITTVSEVHTTFIYSYIKR